ncbi:MAG: inosine-5-monophosphate dehydrogenase [Micavibrio sp.]|nr:MAG: inosine-5-monophosphate dehydrogenase [Micavibrio sp.]
MTQIRDVMSRDFKWVPPETTLRDAARIMRDNDVGFLPIGENDRMVGIITDRDITVRAVAEGFHPQSDTVRSVMTPGPFYCYEDQNVAEICDNMSFIKVRRLPVVSRDKRLVGVVSLGDLAQICQKAQTGDALRQITNHGQASQIKAEGKADQAKAA